MNKNLIKKTLIVIGIILLSLNFIICYNGDVFLALFSMSFNAFVEFGDLESILSIVGMGCLFFGLIIKKENTSYTVENNKKLIVKYNIFRILGCLPFIGILCFAINSAINGFSFFFTTYDGLEAFFDTIFFFSLIIWPLYIIGGIIIIKSSSKIRDLKNSKQ